MTTDDDERIVADEVARLRVRPDGFSKLQAELLSHAPAEVAAAFLRECALRSLARFDGKEDWAVSAILQADAHSEWRRRKRQGRTPIPQPEPY